MPTVNRGLYRWLFHSPAVLEDFADRISHFWTFSLLLILAGVISWKHGFNEPITCWSPSQFTPKMVQFTDAVCWNSHFIRYPENVEEAMEKMNISEEFMMNSDMPIVSQSKDNSLLWKASTTVTLYQWLPLILCFQALLFKLPSIIFYVFHGFTGVNFEKMHGLTTGYENMPLKDRQVLGRQISRYILRWCRQFSGCPSWRLLTLLWLSVKILYCVNILIQLSVLNSYLVQGPPLNTGKVTSFGSTITGNIKENNGTLWKESPVLPRDIMCMFEIPQLQNIQTYMVKCHLPANHFNERAYMFLWVWFVFVAVVTCSGLAVWIMYTMIPVFRKRYIARAVEIAEGFDLNHYSPADFDKLCGVIGEDGVMLLKLVGSNSSELAVRDVVCGMLAEVCAKSKGGFGGAVATLPEDIESSGGKKLE